jgi:hypothetical protein
MTDCDASVRTWDRSGRFSISHHAAYTIDTFWRLYRAPGCVIESRRMAVDSKPKPIDSRHWENMNWIDAFAAPMQFDRGLLLLFRLDR